jgi:hypothetical protein
VADEQMPSHIGTMSTILSGSRMENGRLRSVQMPRHSLARKHSS